MCQYLYAIPGHNANVERIFSLIMTQWIKKRNRLQVETVESIIQFQNDLFGISYVCYGKTRAETDEKVRKI